MILRPMLMSDADQMLEWKNYEETRKFAIASHEEIKREDHLKWLENNIQYFQVIESAKGLFGAVRIQDNEVSIWVDRTLWGKGIATWILNKVSTQGMTAKIVDGNVASMRTFIKCGFMPEEYIQGETNYYIFKKCA